MQKTAVLVHECGNPLATTDLFRVGMAQTLDDVIECQRLRYLVFNCELGEGLDSSAPIGLDRDRVDFICDHLMVRDASRDSSNPKASPQEKALASLTRRHSAGHERNRESRRPCRQIPPIPV